MKKHVPRTTQEKLRGLVNMQIRGETSSVGFYTQKELVALLGVSERTIRRFKNQPGYQLAPKTLARLKQPVSKQDATLKRLIEKGTAFYSETKTIKGVKRRRIKQVRGEQFKIPQSRILQLPVIFPSKNGLEQTVSVNVKGWTLEEKIAFVQSAYESKRFTSWRYRKSVPRGHGYVVGTLLTPGYFIDLSDSDVDEETKKSVSRFTSEGPFSFRRLAENYFAIEQRMTADSEKGTEIVELNFVEKIKKSRRKGKKK